MDERFLQGLSHRSAGSPESDAVGCVSVNSRREERRQGKASDGEAPDARRSLHRTREGGLAQRKLRSPPSGNRERPALFSASFSLRRLGWLSPSGGTGLSRRDVAK